MLQVSPIFWNKEFLNIQSPLIQFFEKGGYLIPYEVQNETARIGYKGPYGGCISLLESGSWDISDIWTEFIQTQKQNNVKRIEVRLPPSGILDAISELNQKVMTEIGFTLKYEDVNSIVHLDKKVIFNRNRKRDLKTSQQKGLNFRPSTPQEAYSVICLNRLQKKVPVSIDLSKIIVTIEKFPEVYDFFCIEDNFSIVCGAITMRVDTECIYVFMWGNDKTQENSGIGMSMLADGIFQEFRNKNYKKIDLGVSSINGNLDLGLNNFKRSLGSIQVARNTYCLDLSARL